MAKAPVTIHVFALNSGRALAVEPDVKIKFAAGLLVALSGLLVSLASAEIIRQMPVPEANAPLARASATNDPAARPQPLPVLWLNQPSNSPPLQPGVYLTKPYAGMVRVPGAPHDDCILKESPVAPPIPTVKPNLQLIPKPADGK
jgi:hypothetical protein